MGVKTEDRIKRVSFKLFLEKGYYGTSIREICKLSHIEAPTLYYYFKSKKGLLLSLYDYSWEKYMYEFNNINLLGSNISPEENLFKILNFDINYTYKNPSYSKFNIKCRIFPPKELNEELIERYNFWTTKKDMILKKIIQEYWGKDYLDFKTKEEAVNSFNTFTMNILFDILFFHRELKGAELREKWNIFLNFRLNH